MFILEYSLAFDPEAAIRSGVELQVCSYNSMPQSAWMRLPAISIFESWPIRNVTILP